MCESWQPLPNNQNILWAWELPREGLLIKQPFFSYVLNWSKFQPPEMLFLAVLSFFELRKHNFYPSLLRELKSVSVYSFCGNNSFSFS